MTYLPLRLVSVVGPTTLLLLVRPSALPTSALSSLNNLCMYRVVCNRWGAKNVSEEVNVHGHQKKDDLKTNLPIHRRGRGDPQARGCLYPCAF